MKTEKQTLIVNDAIKDSVNELLETSVDERGLPVFGVIEIEDKNGNLVKAYKQERFFDAEDYRKAALYQAKLASNHKILASYYTAEFERKHSNF